MIFGGKANGMKHKFSSVSNDTSAKRSHRGVGQAVAALVMALALTIGGAGTTILLASQPAGLTVAPVTVDWEESSSLKHNNTKKHPSEPAASSAAEEPAAAEDEAAEQEQPAASVSAPATSVTTAEPAASSAAAAPAAPSEPAAEPEPAAPETEPEEDDPMAGSAEEVDHENAAFAHFVQETEELAAEDPLRAPEETADDVSEEVAETPAASENGGDLSAAAITDTNGTILLTPEEIRAALDAGTLDESSVDTQCLDSENGFLKWLWEFLFGKKDDTPAPPAPVYSGWRVENGNTYYYSQTTNQRVTGIQSIDNKLYYFDANGVKRDATFGIDVSKYQASVDFEKVKEAGVQFVIIRLGYRGYGSGTLVQDPKFEEHFTNARNAGLRVGVYCFTQAVNEDEAREEAQACVYVLNGRQLDYPIYYDTEATGTGSGRADGLGVEDRTKCAVAFCEEVKALGYQPGVYASTTWFRKRLDLSQLTKYNIWNAHYNVASSPIACNMWQGSCTARIPGYGGQIDVNISYMG